MSKYKFSLFYQNSRGLNTKIAQFTEEVNCSNYDAIAITESWFRKEIDYFAQLSKRYKVFRVDRKLDLGSKTKGGGVCLLIKSDFNFQIINTPFSELEVLIGYLTGKNNERIVLALHYFPPDLSVKVYKEYCTWFQQRFINEKSKIVFVGDCKW